MDKNHLKKVKEELEVMGGLFPYFDTVSMMYSMTTENIYGFLKNFDVKDKKVLTVGGSGDQRLNAYFMGAKDVTCFDVNALVESQIKLKDAAIKSINFEKFIKFFNIYTKKYSDFYHMLDSSIFNEFSHQLDEDTYFLFDYIINHKHNDVYYSFINDLELLQEMNVYLTPENYEKLRDILMDKNVKFINSDLIDLKEKLENNKYDIILLSNISDYIHDIFFKDHLLEFRKLIDKLIDNLNPNGIIQVGYIYESYKRNLILSEFKNDELREKYFPISEFSTIKVKSFNKKDSFDKVIVYKNSKN